MNFMFLKKMVLVTFLESLFSFEIQFSRIKIHMRAIFVVYLSQLLFCIFLDLYIYQQNNQNISK